jgi:hypothetical protein
MTIAQQVAVFAGWTAFIWALFNVTFWFSFVLKADGASARECEKCVAIFLGIAALFWLVAK